MLLSYLKQGVYGTGCRGAMVTKDQDCIAGKFNRQYSNNGAFLHVKFGARLGGLILLLASCCHQEATVIQTRAGFHYNNSHTKLDVFAYEVVIAETLWVQSADSLGVGDKINGRFR